MKNILNFNENDGIINSPRSIQACKKLDIPLQDIKKLTLKEVEKIYYENIKPFNGTIGAYQIFLEKRRIQKVDLIIKLRQEIIKESNTDNKTLESSKFFELNDSKITIHDYPSANLIRSSMISKEMKNLEQLKMHNDAEIERRLKSEMLNTYLKAKSEEKERSRMEREIERQRKAFIKRKELEENNSKRKEELRAFSEFDRLQKEEKDKIADERYKEWLRREKEKEKEIKNSYRIKAEESKSRINAHKEFLQIKFSLQEIAAMKKRRIFDEKEEKIKKKFENLKTKKKFENELKSEQNKEKYELAQENQKLIWANIKNEYMNKEKRNQKIRDNYQKLKEKEYELQRKNFTDHQNEIKSILEYNNIKLEERLNHLKDKDAIEKKRVERLEKEKEISLQKRVEQSKITELEQKRVFMMNEKIREENVNTTQKKLKENDEKVLRVKGLQEKIIENKILVHSIKSESCNSNVELIKKMDELKRKNYLEKFEKDDLRNKLIEF